MSEGLEVSSGGAMSRERGWRLELCMGLGRMCTGLHVHGGRPGRGCTYAANPRAEVARGWHEDRVAYAPVMECEASAREAECVEL